MKKIILLSLFASLLCSAEFKYASQVKSLYANKDDSKVVARLLPTTKVEVLAKEGNLLKIKVLGWSEAGDIVALYATPNRRILNVGLVKGTQIPHKIISTKSFENKNFNEVSMEFYTDEKDLVNDVAPLYKEANELYTQNCSMCHSLHPLKEFTANQWPSMIKSMLSRTGIPKDKTQLVIQFVQKNAKDVNDLQ